MAVGRARNTSWSNTLRHFSLRAFIFNCWILLPVLAHEEFPEFIIQPQSQIISHLAPVTLICAADPEDSQIRWLFNGLPLDERRHQGLEMMDSNLTFSHLHHEIGGESNDGEYRCTATTSVGTIVSQPAVLAKPGLSWFSPVDDVTIVVPEGGYATLTCEPPRSSPAAYVVFQKSNGELVDTSKNTVHQLPSGNLVLSNITSAVSGEFRCVAVNPVSGHNTTCPGAISLLVDRTLTDVVPKAHIMPGMRQRVQVEVGSDITLECPSYGHKGANITWSKYGGSLPVGRFSLAMFGNLRIRSTQSEDTGIYMCNSHAEGRGEGQVFLEILTPPFIQVVKEPVAPEEVGKRVEMACSVGGFPKPEIRWYHNGRELPTEYEGTLVLAQISSADSGLYQCMATNKLGTAYGVMRLQVEDQSKVNLSARQGDSPAGVRKGDQKKPTPPKSEKPNEQRWKLGRRDRKKHGRRKYPRMGDRRKKKKNGPGGQGDLEKPKYAPTIPIVTQLSDRSVMLNWSVPDKGNGQKIKFFKVQFKEMSPEKGPWRTSDAHLTDGVRRFELSNLKSGGAYKFRILAVYEDNDNKNSANTPIFKLAVQPHAQARAPDTAPTIVETKAIVYQQNIGIGVKWQYKAESASPIEGFIIFYKPFNATEDKEKRIPGAGIRNDVIRDLQPNTFYSIRMQSFNIAGQSQFSNQVVTPTKSREDTSINEIYPDIEPPMKPPETSTEAPITGRRSSADTLEQPVILGIVLGALLLALFILVTMCWWKHRQQKRRNLSCSTQKFQDQSQCVFADTNHTKPNGGLYPANGTLQMVNGHGPHHEGHGRMNIDVNPLADYDMQTTVSGEGRSKQIYGNGINGIVPGLASENSEKGFQHSGSSNHHADLPYMEQPKASYSMQHRTLPLTPTQPMHSYYSEAGSLGRSVNHEYSEPRERELQSPSLSHSMYKQNFGGHHGNMGPPLRNFDYAWSSSYDQPRMDKNHFTSSLERLSPMYSPTLDFAGNANLYPHNKRLLPALPGGSPIPHNAMSNFGTVPGGMSNSGNGKHKRRRKRPHNRDQLPREHVMRDQATNTDLSSNEGTFEFVTYCKSGSSSNSGSEGDVQNFDSSFANNGSLESVHGDDDDSRSATSFGSHEPELQHPVHLPVPL